MKRIKHTIIVAVLMLLTAGCIQFFKNSDDKPIKRTLSEFPMQIGNWYGKVGRFDERIYDILGVDDSILVNYYDTNNKSIQLYIGYYKSQRKGDIIHSPRNCMPGSGWNIVASEMVAIKPEKKISYSDLPKVNKLVIKKGIQSQVALYWFHSRGRVIASEYYQKFYLAWDAVTRYRTDGSFVRITTPMSDVGEKQTTEELKRFAEQILPLLNDFIPT